MSGGSLKRKGQALSRSRNSENKALQQGSPSRVKHTTKNYSGTKDAQGFIVDAL